MAKGIKTGGRQKGSENKVTKELRERIKDFLENTFDDIVVSFNQLEPKDKVKFYFEVMQYGLPKLQSTEQKQAIDNKVEIFIEPESGDF